MSLAGAIGLVLALPLVVGSLVPTAPVTAETDTPPSPKCTTWLTQLDYGFRGDWTPEVAETVYTSTTTAFSQVPCGGCELAITRKLAVAWGGIGPEEQITVTTMPATPTTVTSTICSPAPDSSAEASPPPGGPPHSDISGKAVPRGANRASAASPLAAFPTPIVQGGGQDADCIATQAVPLTPTFGPTCTIWTTTTTVTVAVDCSGCPALTTSALDYLRPGPVVIFDATTTATDAKDTTTYVCRKTPHHHPRPTNRESTIARPSAALTFAAHVRRAISPTIRAK